MITSHPHPPAVCTPFPGAVFPLDQDGSKDFGALQDCIASLPRCAAAPDSQRQRLKAPARPTRPAGGSASGPGSPSGRRRRVEALADPWALARLSRQQLALLHWLWSHPRCRATATRRVTLDEMRQQLPSLKGARGVFIYVQRGERVGAAGGGVQAGMQ
jgi:hypothetical protein